MKLRIKGNSIRLRLLRTEIATLGEQSRVAESISFGPSKEETVTYAVQVDADANAVSAVFRDNEISIVIPSEFAERLVRTDEVGFSAEIDNNGSTLDILVEKDFVCLTRKDDPDNLDAFPNPEGEC